MHSIAECADAPTLTPLTREDTNAFKLYETIIADGLKTFLQVGNALTYIRDSRLYRESHDTFEAYCQLRWGMTDRHASRLIGAAGVVENLGPIGPILPVTESQARPLASLPPVEQREAWAEAVKTAPQNTDGTPKITAAHVRLTMARQRTETGPQDPPRTQATISDAIGHVVTVIRTAASAADVHTAITAAQRVLSRRRLGAAPAALADCLASLLGAMTIMLMDSP